MGNWAKNLPPTTLLCLWDRVAPNYHGLPPFQGLRLQPSVPQLQSRARSLAWLSLIPRQEGAGAAVMALR